MPNTGKLLIVGATAMLIVANAQVTVSQQTSSTERPAVFETNMIYGSDASISTYGLDPARAACRIRSQHDPWIRCFDQHVWT